MMRPLVAAFVFLWASPAAARQASFPDGPFHHAKVRAEHGRQGPEQDPYSRELVRQALSRQAGIESIPRLTFMSSSPENRRPGFGRSVALVLGGIVGSLALSAAVVPVIDDAMENDRVSGDAGYNRTKNVFAVLTSAAGAAAGVTAVGALSQPRGRLASTALGAGIGAIPFLLMYDDGYTLLYNVVFGIPLQSIGAMAGYRLSIR